MNIVILLKGGAKLNVHINHQFEADLSLNLKDACMLFLSEQNNIYQKSIESVVISVYQTTTWIL